MVSAAPGARLHLGRVVAWLVAETRRQMLGSVVGVLAFAGAGLAAEVAGYGALYGYLKAAEGGHGFTVLGQRLAGDSASPAMVGLLAGLLLLGGAWLVHRSRVSALHLRRRFTEHRVRQDSRLLAVGLPLAAAPAANTRLARGTLPALVVRGADDAGRSLALLADLVVPAAALGASGGALLWLSAPLTLGVVVLGAVALLVVLRARASAEDAARQVQRLRRESIAETRAALERDDAETFAATAPLPAATRNFLDVYFERFSARSAPAWRSACRCPRRSCCCWLAPVGAAQGGWSWSDLLACLVALRYAFRSASQLGVGVVVLSRYLPGLQDSLAVADEIAAARVAPPGTSFHVAVPALHDSSARLVLHPGDDLVVLAGRNVGGRRLAAAVQLVGSGEGGGHACGVTLREDEPHRVRLVRKRLGEPFAQAVALVTARDQVLGWCTREWLESNRAAVLELMRGGSGDGAVANDSPPDDDPEVGE